MIVFTRTMTPTSGRLAEAKAFAEKRRDAIQDAYNFEVNLYAGFGGPVGRMTMVSHHDSMGDLEEIRRKVIADAGAGKIPTPDLGLMVSGSVNDDIWIKL